MAGHSSDYHRGGMDIHAQKDTFKLVMGITKWGALTVTVSVLFLTLWFCTASGFLTALISAVVLAAIGGFALREKPGSAH
jgi:hypothetical protein